MAQSVGHVAEERGVAVLHWTGVKIVNRTHDDAMQTGTTLSQSVIDDELSWVPALCAPQAASWLIDCQPDTLDVNPSNRRHINRLEVSTQPRYLENRYRATGN